MNRSKYVTIWIGILSLVTVLATYGQEGQTEIAGESVLSYGGPPDPEEMALKQAGLSGAGFTWIDGDPFLRLQLQPDIDLGKIGFGLDVVLLYNAFAEEDKKILAEDGETWDDISTLLRTVRYLRYGDLSESFYARFGELDYVTIGHGFIMSGYSNYDRRGLRLNLSTKTKKVGMETVINNVGAPTVFGGRLFVRPLQKEEGGIPLLNSLEFGGTYLMDIDPNQIPDNTQLDEDPLVALGADVGFPLIHNRALRLDIYNDVAFLNTKLSADTPGQTENAIGNATGIGLSLPQALFKVEYRIFGEGFYPSIFDYTYDAAKGVGPDFLGIAEDDSEGQSRHGYFSMIAVRAIPQVDFIATFEDYTIAEPKLYLGITESGISDQLSFRAFYVKRNIGEPDPGFPEKAGSEDPDFIQDLFRLDSKSAFAIRVGYEIFPRIEVAMLREYRFQQVSDAAGESRFEPIHKTSVEVGFRLNF